MAVAEKMVDDCVREAVGVHQMAFAPLGKEVEHQTSASVLFRRPLEFWEAWVEGGVQGLQD